MKKLIWLLAFAFCFSGCAKHDEQNSKSILPDTQQEEKQADKEEKQTDNLIKKAVGTTDGRYAVGSLIDKQVLVYLDYAKGAEIALCSAPSCAHNSEDCTAFVNTDYYRVDFFYLMGEKYLAKVTKGKLITDPDKLIITDIDGTNPKELYVCKSGEKLANIFATDTDNLYFELKQKVQGNAKQIIYSLPLKGGEAKQIYELTGQTQFIGVSAREMFFYDYDWGEKPNFTPPEMPKTATEEEIIQNEIDFKNNTKCENSIYKVNIDTNEKTIILQWTTTMAEHGMAFIMQDNTIYWIDKNYLGKINADNTKQQIYIKWPIAIPATDIALTIDAVIKDFVIVTVYDGNINKAIRYSINITTVQTKEISLNYISNASVKPVKIGGISSDSLLVENDTKQKNVIDILPDGTPYDSYNTVNSFAMISFENFLASKPNYKSIDTVFTVDLFWPD